ncbi:MAG: hypothetical protein FWH19_02290 [Treponema sp.]|nr:hypothetical protein [Treponema sp.]
MKRRLRLLGLLLILPCLSLSAVDFGLILDQSGTYNSYGDEGMMDYKAGIIPRFSTNLGNFGEFHLSGGVTAEYANEDWSFVPELLRTELGLFFPFGSFNLGRIHYSDPLGYIAEGLFDGGHLSIETVIGSFSLGGWYTGFLYKNRANIAMTAAELQANNAAVDLNDLENTYFAPSRAIAAFDWEHPGLAWGFVRARLSVLGQFDMGDTELDTQYISGTFSIPVNAFVFDLGGSLGLLGLLDDGDTQTSYAAELRAAWTLPTAFHSRLSFQYSNFSGAGADTEAFLPVTVASLGYVLGAAPSGISMISLDYTARLHSTLAASLSSNYFIRNGSQTYRSYPVSAQTGTGNRLGNEFFAQAFWSPFSDLAVNLGAGVFLPSMGDVTPEHHRLWRLEFGIILSIF